jgi:ribosomal protein S12 methylthiotransferase
MPVQHASQKVLSLMNRAVRDDTPLGVFKLAREIRPDFALRTTCMVGFPGERREDFDTLLRFLEDATPDRMGAFIFSPEENTPAADMPNQVDPRTKRSRMERLMAVQEEISLSRQRLFLGRELDVLIDSSSEKRAEGRSFREAPEVDGVIEIEGTKESLRAGDRIGVLVTGVSEHDMTARAVCP